MHKITVGSYTRPFAKSIDSWSRMVNVVELTSTARKLDMQHAFTVVSLRPQPIEINYVNQKL